MKELHALSPEQHKMLEHPSVPAMMRTLAINNKLKSRTAPLYCKEPKELVASLQDVKHLIRTGDGSWYRGVKPWSLAIRMGTQSMVSHAGTLGVEDSNVYNIDTCEMVGCRKRPLVELVHDEHAQKWNKGQWYWGPISEDYRCRYDEEEGWKYLTHKLGSEYGHIAICFVAASLMPGFRELLFLRWGNTIEKDWKNVVPYCSALQAMGATAGTMVHEVHKSAGIDPCPGRALQLTTPQDTWQSLFWGPKVALIP